MCDDEGVGWHQCVVERARVGIITIVAIIQQYIPRWNREVTPRFHYEKNLLIELNNYKLISFPNSFVTLMNFKFAINILTSI